MISGIKLLRRNLISNAVGVIAPALAWVLVVPLLVHRLGEHAYGVYTVAISFAGILGFLELGLTSAATKYIAEVDTRNSVERLERIVSTNVSLYLGLGSGIAVLTFFLAPYIAPLVFRGSGVDQQELMSVVRLVGVLFALTVLRNALSSVPRGFQRYDIHNAIQVTYAIGLALTQGAIVLLGGRVLALMLGNLAVATASLIGFTLVVRRLIPTIRLVRLPDRGTLQVLFGFGMYMMVINATGTLLFTVDKVIVGWTSGVADVTYYAVPTQTLLKFHTGVAVLTSVLFPLASEVQSMGDQATLRKIYLHSTRFVMLIYGLLMAFVGTFAREILAMWISPGFAALSSPILAVMSLGYLFLALSITPYHILIGTGHPREMAVLNIMAALCVVLGLTLGVTRFGLVGGAVGATVGMGAMVVLPWYVQRLLHISWRRALIDGYGRTLVCSVVGIAAGALLSRYLVARLIFYPGFAFALLTWGNVEREDWHRVRSLCRQAVARLPVSTG
ncbi:MAG: oligosaccharide flippase family protein [Anaerolineae bacterium]|jgi:O-antigen/teichoic acid export membrane protein